MLAGLGSLGTWLRNISQSGRDLRRRLLPDGARYELFDCSVLLFCVGLFAYTLTTPPPSTALALSAPLRVVTEMQLGLMLTVAGAVGIATAFSARWTRVGYIACISIAGALSLNFLVGWLSTEAGWRALAQAVLYGWVARRLIREAGGL